MNKIIQYNGKTYKIKKIIKGIDYNYCEADFLYQEKWHEVKNLQILINLTKECKKG